MRQRSPTIPAAYLCWCDTHPHARRAYLLNCFLVLACGPGCPSVLGSSVWAQPHQLLSKLTAHVEDIRSPQTPSARIWEHKNISFFGHIFARIWSESQWILPRTNWNASGVYHVSAGAPSTPYSSCNFDVLANKNRRQVVLCTKNPVMSVKFDRLALFQVNQIWQTKRTRSRNFTTIPTTRLIG